MDLLINIFYTIIFTLDIYIAWFQILTQQDSNYLQTLKMSSKTYSISVSVLVPSFMLNITTRHLPDQLITLKQKTHNPPAHHYSPHSISLLPPEHSYSSDPYKTLPAVPPSSLAPLSPHKLYSTSSSTPSASTCKFIMYIFFWITTFLHRLQKKQGLKPPTPLKTKQSQ